MCEIRSSYKLSFDSIRGWVLYRSWTRVDLTSGLARRVLEKNIVESFQGETLTLWPSSPRNRTEATTKGYEDKKRQDKCEWRREEASSLCVLCVPLLITKSSEIFLRICPDTKGGTETEFSESCCRGRPLFVLCAIISWLAACRIAHRVSDLLLRQKAQWVWCNLSLSLPRCCV